MTNRTYARLVVVVCAAALIGCDDARATNAPSAVPQPVPAGTPVASWSGEFTLTVTSDAACDFLPTELRTRTYGATWTLDPSWHATEDYYAIRISGPPFLQGSFFVAVRDDDAIFGLGWQGRPAYVEQLSPIAYFALGGSASASLPPSVASFDASMDGYVEYCVMKSPADSPVEGNLYDCAPDRALTRVRCESNRHRLNWERQ